MKVWPLITLSLLPAFPLCGEITNSIEIASWYAIQDGSTNGWQLSDFSTPYYSDGVTNAVKFNRNTTLALSPRFPLPIIRIDAQLKCSPNATRFLAFSPTDHPALIRIATQCPSADKMGLQTFAWDANDDIHQFKIAFAPDGSGATSWGLGTLAVVCDDSRLAAPTDLMTSATNCNAFTAAWTPPAEAVRSTVCVSQLVVSAETYATNRFWSFDSVTNGTGSNIRKDNDLAHEFNGLSGTNIYITAGNGGYITIGSNNDFGTLFVPSAEGSDTLLFKASKPMSDNYGRNMLVTCYAGEATLQLGEIVLTTEPKEFRLRLPSDFAWDSLALTSTTNHIFAGEKRGAVNLRWIKLVSNYMPPQTNATHLLTQSTRRHQLKVSTPGAGTYQWFVTAAGEDGTPSWPSALEEITLCENWPRFKESGLAVHLR